MRNDLVEPETKPANPRFSSGPCAKRPGFSLDQLQGALLGRAHRSIPGREKIALAIDLTRKILEVPGDHAIMIVPASDTGAMELAMWNLLGERGVDLVAWESFGLAWCSDVVEQLKLDDARKIHSGYGLLPDLREIDFDRDVVFTWNGTTSGVRLHDADFIPAGRKGLTICDATSAAFAQRLDFSKLDAVTFSWQKAMGGEAGHGMLVLSPRAIERLKHYSPAWPLPKIFRLKIDGKFNEALFKDETLNTPSLLCIEDYIKALEWAGELGGLDALIARADANFRVIEEFVSNTPWLEFLASEPATRSNTSVCLVIADRFFSQLDAAKKSEFIQSMTDLLEVRDVAFDIASHRHAPPGLRIWSGVTVEKPDLKALMPWLEWAFQTQCRVVTN